MFSFLCSYQLFYVYVYVPLLYTVHCFAVLWQRRRLHNPEPAHPRCEPACCLRPTENKWTKPRCKPQWPQCNRKSMKSYTCKICECMLTYLDVHLHIYTNLTQVLHNKEHEWTWQLRMTSWYKDAHREGLRAWDSWKRLSTVFVRIDLRKSHGRGTWLSSLHSDMSRLWSQVKATSPTSSRSCSSLRRHFCYNHRVHLSEKTGTVCLPKGRLAFVKKHCTTRSQALLFETQPRHLGSKSRNIRFLIGIPSAFRQLCLTCFSWDAWQKDWMATKTKKWRDALLSIAVTLLLHSLHLVIA